MDGRDHPFILGATRPMDCSLQGAVDAAVDKNAAGKQWSEQARLMTFGEAVLAQIDGLPRASPMQKDQLRARWAASQPNKLSNAKARKVADALYGKKNSVSRKIQNNEQFNPPGIWLYQDQNMV